MKAWSCILMKQWRSAANTGSKNFPLIARPNPSDPATGCRTCSSWFVSFPNPSTDIRNTVLRVELASQMGAQTKRKMWSLWTRCSFTWTPSQTLMTKSDFRTKKSISHKSISDAKIIHCKNIIHTLIYAYILPVMSIKKGVSLTTPKYKHDPIVQPQTRMRAISQQHIQHQPKPTPKHVKTTTQNEWWYEKVCHDIIRSEIISYYIWHDMILDMVLVLDIDMIMINID